jgi:dGTPase
MSLKKIPENPNDLTNNQIINIRKEIKDKYAQISVPNDRYIQNMDKNGIYDKISNRNEFSRDRDRIIFSKAFRRLEHKAQVYSHEKGDHYRTRLTHTLEVMQIARSIARNLGLNEDLTEAIALGHDIGHTAFGHQGERVLHEIMGGEEDLGGKLKYLINYGGFKHNYNGLKTVDMLERKYEDIKGLNLTWQVLDGILKHTKINDEKWKIERFIQDKEWIGTILEYKDPITLEGQIVAIADEIAQRQHDLDDGLRDNELKLTEKEIIKYIHEIINYKATHNDPKSFEVKLLKKLITKIKKREKIRPNGLSEKELDNYKWNSLIRDIIDYFIKDVTLNSLENIYEIKQKELMKEGHIDEENNNLYPKRKYFTDKIINFGELGNQLDERLEDYIKNQILNSYSVNRFDGKSIYIVKQLFKAYYTNPKQMPKETLDKLSKRIQENTKKYKCKFFLGWNQIDYIEFRKGHPKDIDDLIKLLKIDLDKIEKKLYIEVNDEDILDIDDELNYHNDLSDLKDYFTDINTLKTINNSSEKEILSDDKKTISIKCLLEHHYVYMSLICDYIAGMTDNYANSEYKKLYLI